MSKHQFGGDWTEEKLLRIRKYLQAYMTIFSGNERARQFTTIYVDAFAGTGYRTDPRKREELDTLFFSRDDPDVESLLKGSARIALEISPPFDRYMFIERNFRRITDLNLLRQEFSDRNIMIENAEANTRLRQFCGETNWRRSRSVVFLDPYGMQVEWDVIEAIAGTRAIDLWILFPLMAVNRVSTKSGIPPDHWAHSLTRLLGTDTWQSEFYPQRDALTLFGQETVQTKEAGFKEIGDFFLRRLQSVFPGVAENPRVLMNSRQSPLFLLCFATSNPKPSVKEAALRIARHILGR